MPAYIHTDIHVYTYIYFTLGRFDLIDHFDSTVTNHDQSMRGTSPVADMLNCWGSGGEPSDKKPKDGVVDLVHLPAFHFFQDVAGTYRNHEPGHRSDDHWMSCKGIGEMWAMLFGNGVWDLEEQEFECQYSLLC